MTENKRGLEKANLQGVRKVGEKINQIDPEKANFEEVRNNITEFGIKIVMDEEKILREQEYDLEDIYNGIDHLAQFAGMKKIDKHYYISINNDPSELGCFAWSNLEEKEWFMENIKEWTWYDDEGTYDIIKFIEEDSKNGN